MKFSYKRTLLVGLAFLSIYSFWQMYDSVMPLILTKTFHLNEAVSGVIMAADNVLSLFMLPLFGALSDRTKSKLGRRTPYILFGTAVAIVFLNILPIIDNSYFVKASMLKLVLFVVVLGALLVAMSIYRSPAVALMPDVTPKPLRSKGNAMINLMGALGGASYLAIAAIMYPDSKTSGLEHVNYQPLFIVISVIMAVSVIIMFATVREPKLAAETAELEKQHPEWDLTEDNENGKAVMPKEVKKSFFFLLASVAFWFFGYNGITTWFTTYVDQIMGKGIGGSSTCLLIATVGAVVSYFPIGILSSKFGRKKIIILGTVVLAVCFGATYFLTTAYNEINALMFIAFAFVGFAWAAINVNSLPMVLEMCRGGDVGKFTGYYYTASMLAQVVTPVLAGALLKNVSYVTLFPYATFFVLCSTVTMIFVRHGDSTPELKKGIEIYDD